MSFDISKLKHSGDFDFDSAKLGALRCGPSGEELGDLRKMARDKVDGETLARAIIKAIVRRRTGDEEVDAVAGGPPVTESEAASVPKDELDKFCDLFIARRLRTLLGANAGEENPKPSQDKATMGCDDLGPAIIAHADSERAQMQRILGQAHESIVGRTAAEAMRNSLQGHSIEDQLKKYALGDVLGEHMRKFNIGGVAKQMRRDALGVSALEAAKRTIKASDNLGQTIAAMRAADLPAKSSAFPKEPLVRDFEPPQPGANPILETNNLLRKQQAYAEEMRPILIRSAELIQTLTDTTLATQALANDNSAQAERHAERSMRVAISSVIIAVITGAISIYYANASPTAEQTDRHAKELQTQLSAVVALAQTDRAAFEKKAAEDRAALATVIAQQSELIKQIRASENRSQARSSASK